MAITAHTMVVELSHDVVVSLMIRLFREAMPFFFSLISLLYIVKKHIPLSHKECSFSFQILSHKECSSSV
jgi:hypothetical protein